MKSMRRLQMAFLYLLGEGIFYLIARVIGLPHAATLTVMLGGFVMGPYRTFLDYRESMKAKKIVSGADPLSHGYGAV